MKDFIYLDHAATTPVHPRVIEAMSPYLFDVYGNPSSVHSFGRASRKAVEDARQNIANSIGAEASQIIFTSGGTEADNLAIMGAALANQVKGKHIITSQIEHHAVLHSCEHLEKLGFSITYLPVDQTGLVSLDDVKKAIRQDTILVTIMYGNNEVGTIQPIQEIGEYVQTRGILFHTDAVQVYGSLDLHVKELPVDMLSLSAHKVNGPKGTGALYVRKEVLLTPQLFGGKQEKKRRAGTENVAGIIGFSTAVSISLEERAVRQEKYLQLRNLMLGTFKAANINFVVNGNQEHFLPHILNVSFPGVKTETMLMNLDIAGVAASSGSACASGSLELSHVLEAMNLPDEVAHSAIRFSFGSTTTHEEVEKASQQVITIVQRLVKK